MTWAAARDLAITGKAIRREAWPESTGLRAWLRRRPGGLWELMDADFHTMRIVQESDFETADAFAGDWTTDPVGTTRDVCQRVPMHLTEFIPPGILISGSLGTSTVTLTASLGVSAPAGIYALAFYLDGVLVGQQEASGPGQYDVTAPIDFSAYSSEARVRAWVDVVSRLPLPSWTGHAEWTFTFPTVIYGLYYRPVLEGGAGPCTIAGYVATNEFAEAVAWRWIGPSQISADWLSGTLTADVVISPSEIRIEWSNATTWVRTI